MVGLNAMLEMLSAFAIHADAGGLSLRAKPGSNVSLVASQPPAVIKELVGVGILSVTRNLPTRRKDLPNWRGTPVGNSEIYRDSFHDAGPDHPGEFYYVVLNEQLTGSLSPFKGVDDRAVLQAFDHLELDLSPVESAWTAGVP